MTKSHQDQSTIYNFEQFAASFSLMTNKVVDAGSDSGEDWLENGSWSDESLDGNWVRFNSSFPHRSSTVRIPVFKSFDDSLSSIGSDLSFRDSVRKQRTSMETDTESSRRTRGQQYLNEPTSDRKDIFQVTLHKHGSSIKPTKRRHFKLDKGSCSDKENVKVPPAFLMIHQVAKEMSRDKVTKRRRLRKNKEENGDCRRRAKLVSQKRRPTVGLPRNQKIDRSSIGYQSPEPTGRSRRSCDPWTPLNRSRHTTQQGDRTPIVEIASPTRQSGWMLRLRMQETRAQTLSSRKTPSPSLPSVPIDLPPAFRAIYLRSGAPLSPGIPTRRGLAV